MLRFALPLLAACVYGNGERQDGTCPSTESCSDETPYGLEFVGVELVDRRYLDGVRATMIGGTQTIVLLEDGSPFGRPFRAYPGSAAGVRITGQSSSSVTVEGVGSAPNYLRIVQTGTSLLYDRYELFGAALDDVALTHDGREEVPRDTPIAWVPGRQRVGVALFGNVERDGQSERERIVDTTMTITVTGGVQRRWDAVEFDAVVGNHSVEITASDLIPRTRVVEVATSAERMELLSDPGNLEVRAGTSTRLCFQAINAGRYVYGLTWRFTYGGQTFTHGPDVPDDRNCASVTLPDPPGTRVPLTAAAGGATMTVQVEVTE